MPVNTPSSDTLFSWGRNYKTDQEQINMMTLTFLYKVAKLNFSTNPTFLFRFLLLLVASPPSVLTTLKKCRKMSRSLRTPLLQPRLNILSVRLYHRLEQDKSYRMWYWTLCRQETWAPTSWLLRCLLVTRAMGRMGSQEKEKLRIRTKKWSPQGPRARQTGTKAVRECILIPTTKVTTT